MLIINLLLAFLALIAALSAFGGETFKKGKELLIKRITKRGYILLFCLIASFVVGIVKELKTNDQKDAVLTDNKVLLKKIDSLRNSNCQSIEMAFRLAINIPREYDDCFIRLTGQKTIAINGRITHPMEIYWGDNFECTFGNSNRVNMDDLKSIKLYVNNQSYNLFGHHEVRIQGSGPRPMTAYIFNPHRVSGITLKIYVKSTDATRGQEDFRRAVLHGDCAIFARRAYRVVNSNICYLRANAIEDGLIRSTLVRGAFVKTITLVDNWTEVETPEGRQGWVKSEKLSLIR